MDSLNELLTKANQDKKKSLTKDDQKIYRSGLLDGLKSNGLTDENIFYFVSGVKFGTVSSFIVWNRDFGPEKQIENLTVLISSQKVKALDCSGKLRMFLALLMAELNENMANDAIVGELLHWLVDLSFKKDGTRLTELSKIFRSNFLSELRASTRLPSLTAYNFSKEYLEQLVLFFEEAVNGVDPKGDEEIDKRNALRNWVKREKEKVIAENKGVEEKTEVISSKEKPEDKKDEKPLPKEEQAVEFSGVLAKKLFELAKMAEVYELKLHELEEDLKKKEHELARVKTGLDKAEGLYKAGLEEKEALRKELIELKVQMEACLSEKKKLEDRVSRQVSVIDVYDQDKANIKSELLNQIATSLKKIYADYKVAESMPMTLDLGENMRDSLDDVFRKLKKIGIDIEGR